jgi:hypothetical protein
VKNVPKIAIPPMRPAGILGNPARLRSPPIPITARLAVIGEYSPDNVNRSSLALIDKNMPIVFVSPTTRTSPLRRSRPLPKTVVSLFVLPEARPGPDDSHACQDGVLVHLVKTVFPCVLPCHIA